MLGAAINVYLGTLMANDSCARLLWVFLACGNELAWEGVCPCVEQ